MNFCAFYSSSIPLLRYVTCCSSASLPWHALLNICYGYVCLKHSCSGFMLGRTVYMQNGLHTWAGGDCFLFYHDDTHPLSLYQRACILWDMTQGVLWDFEPLKATYSSLIIPFSHQILHFVFSTCSFLLFIYDSLAVWFCQHAPMTNTPVLACCDSHSFAFSPLPHLPSCCHSMPTSCLVACVWDWNKQQQALLTAG